MEVIRWNLVWERGKKRSGFFWGSIPRWFLGQLSQSPISLVTWKYQRPPFLDFIKVSRKSDMFYISHIHMLTAELAQTWQGPGILFHQHFVGIDFVVSVEKAREIVRSKTSIVLALVECIDESEWCLLNRGDQASIGEHVKEDRVVCSRQRELPWELIFNPRTGGLTSGQRDRRWRGGRKEIPSKRRSWGSSLK